MILGSTKLTDKEDFVGAALQQTVDIAYKETSKYLLEILFNKYKFVEHLKVNVILALNQIYGIRSRSKYLDRAVYFFATNCGKVIECFFIKLNKKK